MNEDLPEPLKISLAATRDKGVANLRRLRLYLLPRTSQLEVMSLLGAAKSAEEDIKELKAEINRCLNMPLVGEGLKCVAAETETSKRVRSCNDVSFLPF